VRSAGFMGDGRTADSSGRICGHGSWQRPSGMGVRYLSLSLFTVSRACVCEYDHISMICDERHTRCTVEEQRAAAELSLMKRSGVTIHHGCSSHWTNNHGSLFFPFNASSRRLKVQSKLFLRSCHWHLSCLNFTRLEQVKLGIWLVPPVHTMPCYHSLLLVLLVLVR
jgi:hypothetical protein